MRKLESLARDIGRRDAGNVLGLCAGDPLDEVEAELRGVRDAVSVDLLLRLCPARARVAPSPPLGLAAGRTTGPRLGAASEADHGDGGRWWWIAFVLLGS